MALDVVVLVVLGLGLLRGWVKGLLFQVGQIALIAGAWLAGRSLGSELEPTILDLAGATPPTAATVAFVIVFLVVYGVGAFLLHRISRQLREWEAS